MAASRQAAALRVRSAGALLLCCAAGPCGAITRGNLDCLQQVHGRCSAAWREGGAPCNACITEHTAALDDTGCHADDYFVFCANAGGVPAPKDDSGVGDGKVYACRASGSDTPTPTGFACKEVPRGFVGRGQELTLRQCLSRCLQPYACDDKTGTCSMVPPGSPAHSSKPNCEATCIKREPPMARKGEL
eukprot:TRINITY_DN52066_c0_g1_i1.p3 TRINITY_DN52066_c0_g1~~TRINITY_DN52066_c0_g1_i1.p3  ORF type:complete len:189 (+),score=47.86 TRINITY_DN52066_c0_g1_i1:78-644(+)